MTPPTIPFFFAFLLLPLFIVYTLIIILLLLPQIIFCQNNKLEAFANLIDKTWEAEGKWGDGSVFKQLINFEYSLDKTIIIANTKGFIDKELKSFGDRNHGIRKYNKELDKIEFCKLAIIDKKFNLEQDL